MPLDTPARFAEEPSSRKAGPREPAVKPARHVADRRVAWHGQVHKERHGSALRQPATEPALRDLRLAPARQFVATLIEYRADHDLTQRQLGAVLGLTQPHIAKLK